MALPIAEQIRQQAIRQTLARQQQAAQPPATPEIQDFEDLSYPRQQSTLGALKNIGLSGVAMLGNTLDTPGSMVRDVIAGENPLDNLPRFWTDENRITGRDLNRRLAPGMVGSEDTWGNFGAGLLTEILTDPFTFTPIGMARKALAGTAGGVGRAAKATSNVVRQAPVVGKPLGVMSDAVEFGADWTKRHAIAATDPAVKNATDAAGQAAARKATGAQKIARRDAMHLVNQFRTSFANNKIESGDWKDIRRVMEDPKFRSDGSNYALPERLEPIREDLMQMGGELDQLLQSYKDLGIPIHELNDIISYFPRQEKKLTKGAFDYVKRFSSDDSIKNLTTKDNFMEARLGFLRGFDEGTTLVNEITADPEMVGWLSQSKNRTTAEMVKRLDGKYGDRLRQATMGHGPARSSIMDQFTATGKMTPEEVDGIMALNDSFFKRLSEKTGKSVDDLYKGAYAEVTTGQKSDLGKGALLQHGKGGPKGGIEFSAQDGKAVVTAFQSADVSTFANKTGNIFRRQLEQFDSKLYAKAEKAVEAAIGKPAKDANGQWIVAAEDFFAKKFERYLRDGKSPNATLRKVFNRFRDWMVDLYASISGTRLGGKVPNELKEVFDTMLTPSVAYSDKDLTSFAKWVGNLDARYVDEGGFFNRNPLDDMQDRLIAGADTLSSVDSLYGSIAETAVHIDDFNDAGMSVAKALRKAGLKDEALEAVQQKIGVDVDLDDMMLPQGYIRDITRIVDPLVNPKTMDGILRLAHMGTSLFKKAVTTPFPSFHSRNYVSGQTQNYLFNLYSSLGDGFTSNKTASKIMKGEVIEGASNWPVFRGTSITDEDATKRLIEMALENEVIGSGQGMFDDFVVSQSRENLQGILQGITPERRSLLGKTKEYFKNWNEIGANASDYVEYQNRMSPWISQVKRGVDPSEAADRVRVAQIDYQDLSDFEKKYAKVAFPFYSFAKGITKAVTTELMGNPGGRLGKAVRAQRLGSDDDSLSEGTALPDYVTRGAFASVGKNEDGSERVLSGFGLMHEQPLNFLGNPAAESLGLLNPALTFGIEEGIDRSLYFDQPLDQLDPLIGRTMSNVKQLATGEETPYARPFPNRFIEHLVSASPASRLLSTTRQVVDPRKYEPLYGVPGLAMASNLLTGFKFSDVSPISQSFAAKEIVDKALQGQGGRTMEETYVPQTLKNDESLRDLLSFQRMVRRQLYQQRKAN